MCDGKRIFSLKHPLGALTWCLPIPLLGLVGPGLMIPAAWRCCASDSLTCCILGKRATCSEALEAPQRGPCLVPSGRRPVTQHSSVRFSPFESISDYKAKRVRWPVLLIFLCIHITASCAGLSWSTLNFKYWVFLIVLSLPLLSPYSM